MVTATVDGTVPDEPVVLCLEMCTRETTGGPRSAPPIYASRRASGAHRGQAVGPTIAP